MDKGQCIIFRKQKNLRETFRWVYLGRNVQKPNTKSQASDHPYLKLKINVLFCFQFEVTVVIPNAFAESLTVSEYVGLVSNFRQRKFQPIPTYRNFKALVGFKHFHKFHKQVYSIF